MDKYEPRRYFATRLNRQGKKYVGHGDKQADIFWQHIEPLMSRKYTKILDFGCGVGRLANKIAQKTNQYIGVDIIEPALKLAPHIPNAQFIHLKNNSLPFIDCSFDLIIIITVLQHIVDNKQFSLWSNELSRVLENNGQLIIIDNKKHTLCEDIHMKSREPQEVAMMLDVTIDHISMVDAEKSNSHWCIKAIKNDEKVNK